MCTVNETYRACGNPSEPTCGNLSYIKAVSIYNCKEGCVCNKGYVRDPRNGFCILIQDCENSGKKLQ